MKVETARTLLPRLHACARLHPGVRSIHCAQKVLVLSAIFERFRQKIFETIFQRFWSENVISMEQKARKFKSG